jgi:hypothetical protein
MFGHTGQRTSKQFPFVDRRKSKYDKERMGEMERVMISGKEESVPKNGQYFFKEKTTYQMKNGNKLSPWWFRWVADVPHRLSFVQTGKGYTFVKKTDDIVPEGMAVNADGNYQYVDLILMKRPLEEYLLERLAMSKEPGKQKLGAIQKFKQNAHQFALDMSDSEFEEQLANMLGDDYTEATS